MPGNARQKLKLLYLKQMLEQKTDENGGLTMEQILAYLSGCGVSAERKSIYADIDRLIEFGMDIEVRKGQKTEYCLLSRDFQLPELKLLVDAVGSSRFITRKKSLDLIKKLEKLTSEAQGKGLRRPVYVDRRIKNMNESIYYTVDYIHRAISESKKLRFKYFDYQRDGSRFLRRGGEEYVVSPLSLIYSDENYYLAAYSADRDSLVNFRVDRITEPEVDKSRRDRNKITKNFDPAKYQNSLFSMFTGEREKVEMMFHNSLSAVVLDRFGSDVILVPQDADHFCVTVELDVSPTFYSWIFMFGARAYISSPARVVKEFAEMTRRVADSYPDVF